MAIHRSTMLAAALAVILGCGAEKPGTSDDASTDGDTDSDAYWDGYEVPENVDDGDSDAISDSDEGRSSSVDSDGDTTPDWQDEDSDGDTVRDIYEAGDPNPATPPYDSDGDTIPNFRDDDSDDNGIDDAQEGCGTDPPCDSDGDGTFDFADPDNDGDGMDDVDELGGDPASPVDFDGDTTPDYMDDDSDGDTILDQSETHAGEDVDSDEDGTPDRHDDDSDGDGWTDAQEAGDDDPDTWPVDTDDDGTPDFRDRDSDADGLSDARELEAGTDRVVADSDGDGVNDLIEDAYGSDPLDASDNPRVHGDFVFTVPYNEPGATTTLYPEPEMDTLVFSTDIQQADVFFLVDTTFSMDGEIANLVDSLSSDIIPEISDEISDVWFGVGGFDDYPVEGYGEVGDLPFYLVQAMTGSTPDAQAAVESLAVHDGEDLPESTIPALWSVATGGALATYTPEQTGCTGGGIGYPCFRPGAVPIIVLITDAPFHNDADGDDEYSGVAGPPPYYVEAVTQLTAIHAKVVGVCSGTFEAMQDMEDIVSDTGAVDSMGQPLLLQIMDDGSQLGERVVRNVKRLANQVALEVGTEARDVDEGPDDDQDATVFIDRIVPNEVGGVEDPENPGTFCIGALSVGDEDGDTVADVFTSVLPGQSVCFDIYPIVNDIVAHDTEPQLYLAEIDVIGDGITVLDTRDVYFLIPPYIEDVILE